MSDDGPDTDDMDVGHVPKRVDGDTVSAGHTTTETLRINLEQLEYDELELIGATENDKLREFVERMKSERAKSPDSKFNQDQWADELEELIDDE